MQIPSSSSPTLVGEGRQEVERGRDVGGVGERERENERERDTETTIDIDRRCAYMNAPAVIRFYSNNNVSLLPHQR